MACLFTIVDISLKRLVRFSLARFLRSNDLNITTISVFQPFALFPFFVKGPPSTFHPIVDLLN